MENKQKLKNLLINQLSSDSANEKLIAILEGAPLEGELSQGQLHMLTIFLPLKRHKEFLDYTGIMSFWAWNELYQANNVEKTSKMFLENMRSTSKTLSEKLMLMINLEEISDTDFQETLALVQDADDCLDLLGELDTEAHLRQCLEILATFKTSIDTWCQVEEGASQFDCSQLIRMIAMKEIVKKAEEKGNLPNWIKVYDHALSRSKDEKLAIERIDGFRMDFEYWAEVYEKEKTQHAKATRLALQKMQKLKGTYEYWLNLLYDDHMHSSRQDIPTICLTMMKELEGTQRQYYSTWEWLHTGNAIDWQMIFLLKIMQATDKKA